MPASIQVALRVGKRRLSLVTGDVSHGGLSVMTEEDLPLRELVRVELLLPSDGRPFAAMGMLVHRQPPVAGTPSSGQGVQFYGLGRDEQQRWDAFLDRARVGLSAAPPMVDLARLPRGAAVSRQFRRDAGLVGTIEIRFPVADDLRTALLREIPRGAIFFLTELDTSFETGDRVGLELVHPVSGDVFEIEGRVRRKVTDERIRGLEVKLALDDERRARFAEFVLDPLDPSFPGD